MSDGTSIEWCDASWNPLRVRNRHNDRIGWHCEHLTTGCENCYAEGFNLRLGTGLPFKPGHRKDIRFVLDDKTLTQPLRWKRPRRVFVCSMTDLFADFVEDAWVDRVFAIMALAPQHQFQVLTKRAERMREYCSHENRGLTIWNQQASDPPWERGTPAAKAADIWLDLGHKPFPWPLPNCWLGVSAERQEEADERIPHLLQTPAAVRFVSAEPLLGPIYFHGYRPDWVIVGGESGPKARPMNPLWARDIRDQCQAAGVPFFYKQAGEFVAEGTIDPVLSVAKFAHGQWFRRVGKKAAGRLLDGREWNEMPNRAA